MSRVNATAWVSFLYKRFVFYFISFFLFFGYQPRGTGPHETAYTCKGVSLLAIEPWAEGWGRNTQPPRYHYDFIYKRFVTRRIKETKSNSLQQTETILSSYLNRNYPISIKDYNTTTIQNHLIHGPLDQAHDTICLAQLQGPNGAQLCFLCKICSVNPQRRTGVRSVSHGDHQ